MSGLICDTWKRRSEGKNFRFSKRIIVDIFSLTTIVSSIVCYLSQALQVAFGEEQMKGIVASFVVLVIGMTIFVSETKADFTFTFQEVGGNVVATGSGSIDTTDLTMSSEGFLHPAFIPSGAFVGLGSITLGYDWLGLSGPSSFGTGSTNIAPSSTTGDFVGVVGGPGVLALPVSYNSGDALSDSATWDNATFASLGLTAGTYKYTWGSGADADSLTVQVGPLSTPEPSSWVLMGLGLFCLAGGYAYRSRMAVVLAA